MGIYEICNLYDGKATAYVGSSVDIEGRWRDHRNRLQRGVHVNEHLQRAWQKYGAAAFAWTIIEEIQGEANLIEREQYWLDRYLENPKTCYNMACCAEAPMRGRKHTEEAKRKLSEAQTGKKRGPTSEETKSKLSEANKGQVPWSKGRALSAEHRSRLSEAGMGHMVSKETRRKISETKNGVSNPLKGKPYPAFIHRETGEVIPAGVDLRRACQERGFHYQSVWAVASGQNKSYKGWVLASSM